MSKSNNDPSKIDKKALILATFTSQAGCTNWLGYEQSIKAKFTEVKDLDFNLMSLEEMEQQIIDYHPDMLFILLEQGLSLNLCKLKQFLPDCTIVFHYMDYHENISHLCSRHAMFIDMMFLSNRDQIPIYKQHFGIDNIFYCPIGCYELDLDQQVQNIPEYNDKIVFVGNIISEPSKKHIHYERCMFWRELLETYGTRLVNINRNDYPARTAIYNQLPAIYGSAMYSLSMDAIKPGMDGYTSNRIWAILNMGGVPLVQRWAGMEEHGFEDGKNCILFDIFDLKEFREKVNYYDNHRDKLIDIRLNALKLGRDRHTHHKRLEKMLQIMHEIELPF